jgi:hypothetical protein
MGCKFQIILGRRVAKLIIRGTANPSNDNGNVKINISDTVLSVVSRSKRWPLITENKITVTRVQ